ncbi:MAG: DegT/DnrJ/EryC1/StrS family aminotransferase [Bacteroidota bacterium]|nr:DegT/DnrJ/EryC1/StrS family aminotransferase [Bacteroidota bacterium]
MNEIRMVDLRGQYEKISKEIDLAIKEVLLSTSFINGPAVMEFTDALKEYMGVKHVIPCANGTDALQVALMASGLQPGDEVITADFTFVATAETIALLGLKPKLVDVCPGDFTIDPVEIEKAITGKTKAIIPVHLYGQCAKMEEILAIARKHNLMVIEDSAQSMGADYIFKNGKRKKAGALGNIGCTSFFPSKNLGAYGDAGAIFTNDDVLAEKLRYIVNHGMKVRYYHDYVGVNSRLDSIQAAILRIKLKHLDSYNLARQKAAAAYDNAFSTEKRLTIPERTSWSNHIFHQYTLKTIGIDRDLLIEKLKQKSIPAMIYYPVPLHKQKAYRSNDYVEKNFSISNALCNSVISLPIHTELSQEQIYYISQSLLEIIQKI